MIRMQFKFLIQILRRDGRDGQTRRSYEPDHLQYANKRNHVAPTATNKTYIP